MRKTDSASERAKASGFYAHLVDYYAEQASLAERGHPHGPRSDPELRAVLWEMGHEVSYELAYKWKRRKTLPSWPVAVLLERMVGLPMCYMDDPANAKATPEMRRDFRTTWALSDAELVAATDAVARRGRGAGRSQPRPKRKHARPRRGARGA